MLQESTLKTFLDFRVKAKALGKNPTFGFNYKWEKFLMIMSAYFNPQSYGARIEARLIKELELEKVPAKADRGDGKFKNLYIEIKISFIDINGHFNLLQIRPHQKLNAYLIVLVPKNLDPIVLIIPSEDMHRIVARHGTTCHGCKNSTKVNKNIEWRITITNKILTKLLIYKT